MSTETKKASMKEYPLEIETAHSDYERMYMSKGHHDPHVFMAAVREYGEDMPMTVPTHHMVKRMPCNTGQYAYLNKFVEPGTRGAFPATYCFERGPDMYKSPSEPGQGIGSGEILKKPRYRLLEDGDKILPTDYWLLEDAETWVNVGTVATSWIGAIFNGSFHHPCRRPLIDDAETAV